jgi:hypothetical protein
MESVVYKFDRITQHKKVRKFLVACLVLSFIFFFQEFFDVHDFNILYVISKVIIGVLSSIVFAIYFIKVFIFFSLITLSVTTSNIDFNQPIMMGIIAQVKLTGIFYYFFVFAILKGYKVTLKELETTFLCLGLIFLSVYLFVHLTLNPQRYYSPESSIVIHDSKGFRFRLPDVFISIFTFYCFRKFIARNKLIWFILFIICYAYIAFLNDERTYLACVTLVIGTIVFFKWNATGKIVLVCLGLLTLVWLVNGGFDYLTEDLNTTSLDTRLVTTSACVNFISSSPSHFIFGGGNLNELWLNGFGRIYGDSFFLSDIGWIGICYEFGFVGVLICLSLYITLFVELNTSLRSTKSLLILVLRDYVAMRFVLSVGSPVIPYFIGIFVSILAISVYLKLYAKPGVKII